MAENGRACYEHQDHAGYAECFEIAFTKRFRSMSFLADGKYKYGKGADASCLGGRKETRHEATYHHEEYVITQRTGGSDANRSFQVDFSPLGPRA